MNKIMQRMKGLKRAIVLAGLILAGLAPAWAQDLYVIHNGDNYLSHNATSGAVNTASTTTFDPATCFWTISGSYLRPVNSSGTVLGGLYLRPRSGNNNYSLNTSTSTNYASWNGLSDGGQPYYNRYLRLNGTTWQVAYTNSNRGTLRLVTVTPVSTTSTNPTISGADVLTSTGNSTYTASGAAYREGGYTNYHFNNADHFLNGNTAITPANATIGAMYREEKYLIDTHTAVGYKVYRDYVKETGDKTPTLIASTASAYKFAESVAKSIGLPEEQDGFGYIRAVADKTGVRVPAGLKNLDTKPIRHKGVIEIPDMIGAVEESVK